MSAVTDRTGSLVAGFACHRAFESKNRPVTQWSDVTDVEGALATVVLNVDFHSFLDAPISLDEEATQLVRDLMVTQRVALADLPVPFDAV